MAMQSGASGPGQDLASEINVTPLVDVMLVLLVIFMITAPMMHTGVDIDLPETSGRTVHDPEGKLTLSIDAHRRIFLGGARIKWSDLKVKIETNRLVQAEKKLWIEADENLPYSVVVTAMATAREAGVVNLLMLTDPSQHLDLSKLDREGEGGGKAR